MDGVGDVTEVATVGSIPINEDGLVLKQSSNPFRDDGGVSTFWILPRTEDVEVTQADASHAVASGEDIGVELIYVFRDRIRRERPPDLVLHLRQRRMITIRGAAGGIDKPLHAGVTRRDEHIQKTGDIAGVGADRVLERAGDGAEGRLVEDKIDGGDFAS